MAGHLPSLAQRSGGEVDGGRGGGDRCQRRGGGGWGVGGDGGGGRQRTNHKWPRRAPRVAARDGRDGGARWHLERVCRGAWGDRGAEDEGWGEGGGQGGATMTAWPARQDGGLGGSQRAARPPSSSSRGVCRRRGQAQRPWVSHQQPAPDPLPLHGGHLQQPLCSPPLPSPPPPPPPHSMWVPSPSLFLLLPPPFRRPLSGQIPSIPPAAAAAAAATMALPARPPST